MTTTIHDLGPLHTQQKSEKFLCCCVFSLIFLVSPPFCVNESFIFGTSLGVNGPLSKQGASSSQGQMSQKRNERLVVMACSSSVTNCIFYLFFVKNYQQSNYIIFHPEL